MTNTPLFESETQEGIKPPLAVIMPAYNEEEGIALAVKEVCREVLDRVPGAYLIVVNDGSKDRTGLILDKLAESDRRIQVTHKQNSGHGPSLVAALNHAHAEYVFLLDSDMQIPLTCFPELWQAAATADGVFGIRDNRQDPQARLLLSAIISITLRVLFNVNLVDTNVPCKIVRRKIWNELYLRIQDDSLLAPSIAIAIYAKRHKYKIVDMLVPHRARSRGQTSLRLKPLLKFCFNGFKQLMVYKDKIS